MKTLVMAAAAVALLFPACASVDSRPHSKEQDMELGAFSVSLAVKDLETSRAFYEKLGFQIVGGDAGQNWLILRNGTTTIGLFQGMFEKNLLTFNPGWNPHNEALEDFVDVREIQARIESQGVDLTTRADPSSEGPASFTLVDPDGNPILFDQHVK